jgi:hypothetical protein
MKMKGKTCARPGGYCQGGLGVKNPKIIKVATTTSPICLLFGRTFANITYLRACIERLCEAEEEKDSQQKRPSPHRHPYVDCGQAGVGC